MFSCPACHHSTITLLQRIAASDPDFPAVCSQCGKGSVADTHRWSWLAWPDAPAAILIIVLWLATGSWKMAACMVVVLLAVAFPIALVASPLRIEADPSEYPASLGVYPRKPPSTLRRALYVFVVLSAVVILAGVAYVFAKAAF